MKSTSQRKGAIASAHDPQIARLEILVDELIKDNPQETQIRMYMEAAGLKYSVDPIGRMNLVLAALNGAKVPKREKGGDHGKSI